MSFNWNYVPRGKQQEARICNCVGPRNGAPVCPCLMPGYLRRQSAENALQLIEKIKPRFRVKAGRRETE